MQTPTMTLDQMAQFLAQCEEDKERGELPPVCNGPPKYWSFPALRGGSGVSKVHIPNNFSTLRGGRRE
eukprot:2805637-Prymnesium_polylepis.2